MLNDREVVYHYDNEDVPRFGTYNNRLEYYDTFDTGATPPVLLSTTYYYYWCNGNPYRIVTHAEGTQTYSAIRFEYAKNGEAVTHVLGEFWTWDGQPASCPANYNVTFAREFRYDTARQRYYNAVLSTVWAKLGIIQVESVIWSDYDGDEVYGDYTVVGGSPPTITDVRSFDAGLGRSAWTAGVPGAADYYHSNLLGTTRFMTDSGVAQLNPMVYTAFGELIAGNQDGTADRYGYVGTSGYQAHDNFPYLHVGRRYYDPATGRFVQRDPIGIGGGSSVYGYVRANPVIFTDPNGLGPVSTGIYAGICFALALKGAHDLGEDIADEIYGDINNIVITPDGTIYVDGKKGGKAPKTPAERKKQQRERAQEQLRREIWNLRSLPGI